MFDQLNSKAPHTQNKFPVSKSAPECPVNSDTEND